MEEKIRLILERAVEDEVFPGAVAGFIKDGQTGITPVGQVSYDPASKAVTKDTLYDVASITKAIPTSSLALYLLDHNQLHLGDTVEQFLPHFINPDVTIWHLLTQTVTYEYNNEILQLSKLKNTDAETIYATVYAALINQLGTVYSYTNATSIILGHVIEEVMEKSLDNAAQEIFFTPLNMMRTTFFPSSTQDVAPTEIDSWRGEVRGIVHDESAYILRKKGVVGSAGLFSTVPDLLSFLRMLLNNGESNGKRFFSENIISHMHTNQLTGIGASTGLGWELNQPQYMGKYTHPTMFGKTGFTGCNVVIDPRQKRAMVLLSNYTYPRRKPSSERINEVRRAVADIVFS